MLVTSSQQLTIAQASSEEEQVGTFRRERDASDASDADVIQLDDDAGKLT